MLEVLLIQSANVLIACNDIHDAKLEILLGQQQILMLGMDIYQSGSKHLELSHTGGCVVDEGTTLARCRQFATNDATLPIEIQVLALEEFIQPIATEVKFSFDDATILASFDAAGVGTLSQQQTNGAEQDTLAGTRLASDHAEAPVEVDVQLVNERVVLYE